MRARTAIGRAELSRPLKCAIADGLLSIDVRLLDYGCGRGDDLRLLTAGGYAARGWDPVHRPHDPLETADVVNLGYVVNVIENPQERQAALQRAWDLAGQVLIVSARLSMDARFLGEAQDFADGLLTSRGTFQKFFDQLELRNWIDHTLGVSAVPAAPGVFYVFRDEEQRSAFIASRYRRRLAAPRLTRSAALYAEHEALLQPLMNFVTERGRLPADDELPNSAALWEVLGTVRKAFRVILNVTDSERWDQIARERGQDLLIYLALARFEGRPNFSRLPQALQRDVKGFFSNYRQACAEADKLLYSLGAPGVREAACTDSPVGKPTPSALYVHESALPALSPLLRLFEGCAQAYLGRVDGANIIKLHRGEPKVSYLSYPNFESDPHPALASALTVHLQTFRVKTRDYADSRNRPILHRKELFLAPDHPLFEKFARLTRIEESKGLFDDTSRIGLEEGWKEMLAQKGLYLRGHRLLVAQGRAS